MRDLTKTILITLMVLSLAAACGDDELDEQPGAGDASVPSPDGTTAPASVQFTDTALEGCVRKALGKATGDIAPKEMTALEHLECQDSKISSLAGLEHATALRDLSLWENQVVTVDALAGLTKLTSLQLGHNQITEIKALAKLTGLTRLGLSANGIKDLSPLAGLTGLRWLNLDHNLFGKDQLTHLAKLTGLTWLTLEHNKISDTSKVLPLTKAGAEVYSEYREPDQSAAVLKEALVATPVESLTRGKLIFDVGAGGALTFAYATEGGRQIPLVPEFSDEVKLRGTELYYRTPMGAVAIGRIAPGHNRAAQLCSGKYAGACEAAVGKKPAQNGKEPVLSLSLTVYRSMPVPYSASPTSSDQDLLPYVFASPNQLDAGTCLFMSVTGAMEILMNQRATRAEIKYKGATDLSERFLMNASSYVPSTTKKYTMTDLIYSYAYLGGSLLDKDYNFTAGYVKKGSNGGVVEATSDESGAYFSCYYNWLNKLPSGWQKMLVKTPRASRTTIFVDPKRDKNSIWRVGLMNDDMVERIKWELRTKNAPVIVIYNHYMYWHADIVVGYDDTVNTVGCPMVDSTLQYFEKKGATSYIDKIKKHKAANGGCSNKGIFYVRDSIYDGGDDELTYTYSTSYNFKKKYSKRLVKRSYNWVKYLANHAYTVHRQ